MCLVTYLIPLEAFVFFKHDKKQQLRKSDLSAQSLDEIVVHLPTKLPSGHFGEEIQFAVSPVKGYSCVIDRTVWKNSEANSATVTMSGSVSSLEHPVGSFILSCSQSGAEKVQCIGNIRPDENPQVQYELRPHKSGFHTIKTTLKSFYDPPSHEDHQKVLQEFRVTPEMNRITNSRNVDTKRVSSGPKAEISARRLTDTNNVLDVFFVYTPVAVTYLGGETAMELAIELAVQEANVVFENSNIGLRMRSVGSMLVLDDATFVEPNDMSELLNLATSYIGM